jgi:LPS export ABC transporter protein LptC
MMRDGLKRAVSRSRFQDILLISAAILLVTAIISSCRFSYKDEETDDSADERKVSFVLQNSRYTVQNADGTALLFQAENLAFFEDEETAELEHFSFQFTENSGAAAAEGSAEYAVIAMDTEDVQMNGDIHLEFTEEKTVISASDLFWDNSERTLTSQPDSVVTVQKSDGTIISGYGFSAHVYQRTFSFSGQTEGTLTDSKNGSSGTSADME